MHVAPRRGGGASLPLPSSVSHHASRWSGYKTLERRRDVTPSFESVLSDFCQLTGKIMSETRRPLGSLASGINVGGGEVAETSGAGADAGGTPHDAYV